MSPRVDLPGGPSGEVWRADHCSTDGNDAEKWLRKRLPAKHAGVLPEPAIGSLTLKEATDDLIADYKTNGRRSLSEFKGKIELHLLPTSANDAA